MSAVDCCPFKFFADKKQSAQSANRGRDGAMKILHHTSAFVLLVILGLTITGRVAQAQQEGVGVPSPTPTPRKSKSATVLKNQLWLGLAKQLIVLLDTPIVPIDTPIGKGTGLSPQDSATVDATSKSFSQLTKLPDDQVVEALRYIVTHSTTVAGQYTAAVPLVGRSPKAEDVRLVLPFFQKWPTKEKNAFLLVQVFDEIMLRPEVPEFREFPLLVLQQGATQEKTKPDEALDELLGQAALLLVVRPSAVELQAMHDALARHPEAGGIWNALTQSNALTPEEIQKAREMYPAKEKILGWKLTLAAALSPYDPKMRGIVRQAIEADMKAKADFDYAALLRQAGMDSRRLRQLQEKSQPGALMLLRFWELNQALPLLQRLLRSKNPMVSRFALPTLVVRAPQEVIRVARQPDAGKTVMNLKRGVAFVGVLHPQLRSQAADLLAQDYDRKRGPEGIEENFWEHAEGLRIKGVARAF